MNRKKILAAAIGLSMTLSVTAMPAAAAGTDMSTLIFKTAAAQAKVISTIKATIEVNRANIQNGKVKAILAIAEEEARIAEEKAAAEKAAAEEAKKKAAEEEKKKAEAKKKAEQEAAKKAAEQAAGEQYVQETVWEPIIPEAIIFEDYYLNDGASEETAETAEEETYTESEEETADSAEVLYAEAYSEEESYEEYDDASAGEYTEAYSEPEGSYEEESSYEEDVYAEEDGYQDEESYDEESYDEESYDEESYDEESYDEEYDESGDDGYTDRSGISDSDLDLLAAIIYCEAGGESYEGQVAVGAVVLNRMESELYPDDMEDVIYQSGQFEPTWNGMLSNALASGVPDYCYESAQAALDGENPVGDCLYFHAGSGGDITIGNQTFY